jgi:hypothetical protein
MSAACLEEPDAMAPVSRSSTSAPTIFLRVMAMVEEEEKKKKEKS